MVLSFFILPVLFLNRQKAGLCWREIELISPFVKFFNILNGFVRFDLLPKWRVAFWLTEPITVFYYQAEDFLDIFFVGLMAWYKGRIKCGEIFAAEAACFKESFCIFKNLTQFGNANTLNMRSFQAALGIEKAMGHHFMAHAADFLAYRDKLFV